MLILFGVGVGWLLGLVTEYFRRRWKAADEGFAWLRSQQLTEYSSFLATATHFVYLLQVHDGLPKESESDEDRGSEGQLVPEPVSPEVELEDAERRLKEAEALWGASAGFRRRVVRRWRERPRLTSPK